MHYSFVATLGFWQSMAAGVAIANPLGHKKYPRSVDAGAVSATTVVSATTSTSSASVTLYELNKVFQAVAPPTTAPTSGCALYSQQATNYETLTTITAGFQTATQSVNVGLSSGFICKCVDSSTVTSLVLVGTSYNNYGTEYLYCETGGLPSVTAAQTTILPQVSADLGSPLNPDWADVSCSYGVISDPNYNANPWTVWNQSGSQAAWNDLLTTWNDEQGSTDLSFNNFVWDFFKGPLGPQCDQLGGGTCDTTINCGQYTSPNAPVNSPAGYVILDSMVTLHRILESYYFALVEASAEIALGVGPFTEDFSPITTELAAAARKKVLLDIIQIIVGAVGVLFFEAALPVLITDAFVESLTFAAVKTQIYLQIGAALGLTKDRMQTPTVDSVTDEVSGFINIAANALSGATHDLADAIFNTPDILYGLIQNGTFFSGGLNVSAESGFESTFDASQFIQQALYANALPLTWSTGTSAAYPFIATGAGVADPGASGCDNFYPDKYLTNPDIPFDLLFTNTPDFFSQVFFCVNSAPYWFFTGNSNHDGGPGDLTLQYPTNLNILNGTTPYWPTGQSVVANAVNTWINAGNQNAAIDIDIGNIDTVQTWLSGDLADVAGLVQIPVCSFLEAGQTAKNDPTNEQNNAFWPCPASGATGTLASLPLGQSSLPLAPVPSP